MKQLLLFAAFLGILQLCSCHSTTAPKPTTVSPGVILKNFSSWWNYTSRNINLSKNYQAFDTALENIDKAQFLQSLASGKFIALKINTADSSFKYQLFKLPDSTNRDIIATQKQSGRGGYEKFLMEGKTIPDFYFTDLNGKVYTDSGTRGKIVVLKCWFINCTVCVQEMPALNAFVKEFEGRDDIVFLSLAFDQEAKLKKFLSKTKFDYAVAYASQEYMQEKLGISEYPTQIIVNRQGQIAKVVNEYHDMIDVVTEEMAKTY